MSERDGLLPNFFVVGAPKSGTTSLYDYLDQHPQIYMSPIKEPCYFADELRLENFSEEEQPRIRRDMQALDQYLRGPMRDRRFGGLVSDWSDYLRLFRNARGETAIGEASVCYLWSKTAARNIAARIPGARIIMVLRHPAERAFSQYLHGVSAGLIRRSFHAQIQANLSCSDAEFGSSYPFLEFGLYHEQVRRYLELFPPANVRTYFYDDYVRNAPALLSDIFRFLQVDPGFAPETVRRRPEPRILKFALLNSLRQTRGWRGVRKLVPSSLRRRLLAPVTIQRMSLCMEPEDRAFLVGYYRDDIGRLADLLGRDLSAWLA